MTSQFYCVRSNRLYISLGYRCDVAFQIRRKLKINFAMPFDWLVTPLSSIQFMIEENFAGMAVRSNLEKITYITKATGDVSEAVLNTRYNVIMRHDFVRDGQRKLTENWVDTIPDVRAKWKYIIASWERLISSGIKVCFVRRGGNLLLPSEEPLETADSEFRCLFCFLRTIFPGCKMIVADADCRIGFKDIIEITAGPGGYHDWSNKIDFWKGATSVWDQVLGCNFDNF